MKPLQENEVSSYTSIPDSKLSNAKDKTCSMQNRSCALAHYSKGIPRLINVICDNALLIAYAKAKSSVTTADIEEAAHELKLVDHSEKTPHASPPQKKIRRETRPSLDRGNRAVH